MSTYILKNCNGFCNFGKVITVGNTKMGFSSMISRRMLQAQSGRGQMVIINQKESGDNNLSKAEL